MESMRDPCRTKLYAAYISKSSYCIILPVEDAERTFPLVQLCHYVSCYLPIKASFIGILIHGFMDKRVNNDRWINASWLKNDILREKC